MENFSGLVKKCAENALDFKHIETMAGSYYDGSQRGNVFPGLMVFLPFPYNHQFLESLKRYKGLHFETRISADGLIVSVYYLQDFEKMQELNRKAEIFLSAFWKERHEKPGMQQERYISAGKNALVSAGYSI